MRFIKTTIVGGLVFLVPIVIVSVILGKAFQIMAKISQAEAFEKWIPIDAIGGVALANIITVLAIILLCFLAGAIAKSRIGKKLAQRIEGVLLGNIPGYTFIKGFTDSMVSNEKAVEGFVPVITKFDDNAQIGFEVDRSEEKNGNVMVYLPGAPNPWSGSVIYASADRVNRLDISVPETIKIFQQLGRHAAYYHDEIGST